jgi:hypothetical protein
MSKFAYDGLENTLVTTCTTPSESDLSEVAGTGQSDIIRTVGDFCPE